MHHGNCKCGHHWLAKVLVLLAWLSAVGFWLASWKDMFWNMDNASWFYHVVVFVLLAFGMKVCGCCAKNYKMMGMGGGMMCACSCEGCTGGKCNGSHEEGHPKM